jgi:hypothetical protein
MTNDDRLLAEEFVLNGGLADVLEGDGFGGDHGW